QRRSHAALAQGRFIFTHLLLKVGGFVFECRQTSAAKRNRRSTLSVQPSLLAKRKTGYLCQATRSIFDCVDAIVEIPQLLSLFFVLCTQTLVFLFDAKMLCLLRQTVEAVEKATKHRQ